MSRSPYRLAIARAVVRHLAALLSVAAAAPASHAEGLSLKQFLDPQDDQLDLSEWLLDRKGFLPVPVVITAPRWASAAV